jgi:hypothetical protein
LLEAFTVVSVVVALSLAVLIRLVIAICLSCRGLFPSTDQQCPTLR